MIDTGKIYILPALYFTRDVQFSFLLFHYWLFTITYTSLYSTYIPEKFIEFNDFNKIACNLFRF